jgi:hypothetical protein
LAVGPIHIPTKGSTSPGIFQGGLTVQMMLAGFDEETFKAVTVVGVLGVVDGFGNFDIDAANFIHTFNKNVEVYGGEVIDLDAQGCLNGVDCQGRAAARVFKNLSQKMGLIDFVYAKAGYFDP